MAYTEERSAVSKRTGASSNLAKGTANKARNLIVAQSRAMRKGGLGPPPVCDLCGGSGRLPCELCGGKGFVNGNTCPNRYSDLDKPAYDAGQCDTEECPNCQE